MSGFGIWRDVTDALRQGARRPAFAATVVLSLAIGLGLTAAAANLVDRVLLRPLPYAEAERVVGVWFRSPSFPGGLGRVRQSKATFLHTRAVSQAFEHMALAEETSLTLNAGEHPTRIRGAQVTHEIFAVLGLTVQRGRTFVDSDDAPGAERVAILTDAAWSARFGRDEALLARAIRIDGVSHRVVGILPAAARFPRAETEIWVPLEINPADPDPLNFLYTGYARLRPGVDLEGARDDFERGVAMLSDAYPTAFPRPLLERLQLSALFVPVTDELVGSVSQPLGLALLAALAVLLAVVANVSHLFLARNDRRQWEFAIRSALGATAGRLTRLLVVDASVHAVAGGVVGLILASAALGVVRAVADPVLPRLHEVAIDVPFVAGTLGISLLVGVAVGLVASVRARRAGRDGLGAGGRLVGGRRSSRIGWLLVSAQVAAAVLVATGAGLLVKSTAAQGAIDPGFRAEGLTAFRIFLSPADYKDFDRGRAFMRETVDAVRALPGVETASATSFLPLRDGRIFLPYQIEGDVRPDTLPVPHLTKLVLDDYFQTLGIPLVDGRMFDRHDLDADTEVVVVNAAFARAYWPEGSAVGRRLRYDTRPSGQWHTIAGVVGSVRDREITSPAPSIVYLPYQERHASDRRWREVSLVARSRPGVDTTNAVTALIAQADPDVPVYDVRTMAETVGAATARTRYTMWLMVAFAGAALFLAAVGIYGVLSHVVAGRRREMAVRLALGADPRRLRWFVQRQMAAATGVGILVGVALADLTGTWLGTLLFEVRPGDPRTLVVVVGLVAATGLLAAMVPAMRAATTAPVAALRATDSDS